jgi:hypothetical protein
MLEKRRHGNDDGNSIAKSWLPRFIISSVSPHQRVITIVVTTIHDEVDNMIFCERHSQGCGHIHFLTCLVWFCWNWHNHYLQSFIMEFSLESISVKFLDNFGCVCFIINEEGSNVSYMALCLQRLFCMPRSKARHNVILVLHSYLELVVKIFVFM